jgi:MFS family permease
MKKIIVYNLLLLAVVTAVACAILQGLLPSWLRTIQVYIACSLIGGVGGITYCLRAVYLNACVHKRWDMEWYPWYYIRPIVSLICGAVSSIFLKAGLLVLDATQSADSNLLGFYALAFIAGFNVDRFVAKLEDIAHATWGIEKSRANNASLKDNTNG